MVDCGRMPDLRCEEHEKFCELYHALLGRLVVLEARVRMLEEQDDEDG